MSFKTPWFPTPALPRRVALRDVSPPIGGTELDTNTQIESSSDKSVLDLIRKLKSKGELRNIEWLILYTREEEFEALPTSEQESSSKIIWSHIQQNTKLLNRTLNRLMQGQDRGYAAISGPLVENMPSNVSLIRFQKDKHRYAWVRALIDNDYLTCARIAMSRCCPIDDFIELLGYSRQGRYVNQIVELAATVIPNDPAETHLKWWTQCQKMMDRQTTVDQLELLLAKTQYVETGTKFDGWLNTYCLPDVEDTYWYSLSQTAQKKLKSFYNITSYSVVKELFALLRDTSIDPSLAEWESRNLKSRIDFWSSYSESFIKVRFLLTARSYSLLKGKFDFKNSRITILSDTYKNNLSEICIFEFNSCYVIERFRNNFDMGILDKSSTRDKLLFEREILDEYQVTNLEPDGYHDHINDYQYYAREYLRKSWGVKANKTSKLSEWRKPPADRVETRNDKLSKRYGRLSEKRIYY